MWEPMNLNAKKGDKVVFDGVGNGWKNQWEDTCKILVPNGIYEVENVEVGSWLSSVYLSGISEEDNGFNTVLFSNYKEDK